MKKRFPDQFLILKPSPNFHTFFCTICSTVCGAIGGSIGTVCSILLNTHALRQLRKRVLNDGVATEGLRQSPL